MKGLTLTTKEQRRLQVLNSVLERRWSMREAAGVMGVSEREGWRLLAAYRREGAAALAHKNRGRVPPNATSASTRQQVVALGQRRYAGINHTHLTELLAEREGIVLSRPTVRRLLVGAGLASPRGRRPPRHRCRRQRMPQEGMLLQMDGSYHPWLEDRGPWLTLLLAVDDATGTVPYAVFREQEDTQGYFQLLRGVIAQRGIPLAVYTDRHGVFQHQRQRQTMPASGPPKQATQFGRALRELGVTQVLAHSPEAKGRVERAKGTFQDRLVSELRLAGAATLNEANRVLEAFRLSFNQRFGVPAAQPESAYRPADPGLDLPAILCVKERRRVAKDNTVRYHGHTLQLFPDSHRLSYAGARVEVQERHDHRLLVCYQGKVLTPMEAPPLATQLRAGTVPGPAVGGTVPTDFDAPVSLSRPIASASPLREPLAGDPIWCGVTSQNGIGWELVKVAVGQSAQQGKRVGRPPVTQRPGFPQQLSAMISRLDQGNISRRQAAKELDIGYATLKRLLDSMPWWEPGLQTKENGTAGIAPDVPSPSALPIYHTSGQGTRQGIIDPTDKIAEH